MKLFSDLRVGKKVLSVVTLLSLSLAGAGYLGVAGMHDIGTDVASMHDKQVVPLGDLLQAVNGFQRTRVLTGDIVQAPDMNQRIVFMGQIDEIVRANEEINLRYEATLESEEGKLAFADYKTHLAAFAEIRIRVIELALMEKTPEAFALLQGEGGTAYEAVQSAMTGLVGAKLGVARQSYDSAASAETDLRRQMVGVVALATLAGAGLGAMPLG